MNTMDNQFTYTSACLMAAVALFMILAFAPGEVFAIDKDAHEDRAELRIKAMHAKLNITPAEEEQWAKVAEVMRDNGKTMDTLTQARVEHAKGMTAVDDLQSYGEITQAYADGIKEMTPVFADLYASLSEEQQKKADNLFHHGYHKHGHMMSHTMKGGS